MTGVSMKEAGRFYGQRRLGSSLRIVMLLCLLMLFAVANAAPYVSTSFSVMTRGLSQMHSEFQGPDHLES